jgi:hypothetical protein
MDIIAPVDRWSRRFTRSTSGIPSVVYTRLWTLSVPRAYPHSSIGNALRNIEELCLTKRTAYPSTKYPHGHGQRDHGPLQCGHRRTYRYTTILFATSRTT